MYLSHSKVYPCVSAFVFLQVNSEGFKYYLEAKKEIETIGTPQQAIMESIGYTKRYDDRNKVLLANRCNLRSNYANLRLKRYI